MANEVRLIDANAFYEQLEDIRMEYLEEDTMSSNFAAEVIETVLDSYLKDAPTIDPESLRPKGRWTENHRVGFSDAIEDDVYWFTYTCSECGGVVMNDYHYCPNCGADMRGEVDE